MARVGRAGDKLAERPALTTPRAGPVPWKARRATHLVPTCSILNSAGEIVSGAGGHEGGKDVVRVAVEVLAGAVVAHGGSRVGVAGRDLHIA